MNGLFQHIPDWGQALIALAAILTAVSYIYTRWVRPVLALVRETAKNMDTLHDIAAEFRPNHGTSLRDRIDRIENQTGILRIQNLEMKAVLEERAPIFDEIKATLDLAHVTINDHMAEDTALFAAAQAALIEGQMALNARLQRIENQLDLVPKRISDG